MPLPLKPKISDFPAPMTVQGNIKIAAQDPNNPNLSEQNVGPTLDQIRAFVLSGVPTSPGVWITQPSITVFDNGDGTVKITVSEGSANFPSGIIEYNMQEYPAITLPAPGLNREDAITGLDSQGEPGSSTAPPPIPTGSLLVNFLTLSNIGAVVQAPEGPTFSNEGFSI
jgi:hypothetical protein